MQRPAVVRLDPSVARTAFDVGRGCGGVPSGPSVLLARAVLELRRAGCDALLASFTALEVDDEGRQVFAWDARLRRLPPGLYAGRLRVGCAPCGEVLLQLGGQCAVMGAENIPFGPACEGPQEGCAGSTVCVPCSEGCGDGCGDDCCSDAGPVIYVPAYTVQRGC